MKRVALIPLYEKILMGLIPLCALVLIAVSISNSQDTSIDDFLYIRKPELVSFALVEGKIEVVFRERSRSMMMSYPPQPIPDEVWKEVYIAKDGEIVLDKTIKGKHTPAKELFEKIEFDEQ